MGGGEAPGGRARDPGEVADEVGRVGVAEGGGDLRVRGPAGAQQPHRLVEPPASDQPLRRQADASVGAGPTGGTFTEAELDRVESGADGFGEAVYGEGVCRPGVEAPAGASREVRVLARLGRVA